MCQAVLGKLIQLRVFRENCPIGCYPQGLPILSSESWFSASFDPLFVEAILSCLLHVTNISWVRPPCFEDFIWKYEVLPSQR